MEKKLSNSPIIRVGNHYNLHTGYHNPFFRHRNKYFIFKRTKPEILCFLLKGNKKNFHPAKNPFYFEVHKYPDDSEFIQSAFFPVYNQVPWIADMDNICLPLFGNACINSNLMQELYKNYFKNPLYRKTLLARIGLYSSPFCKGILFRSLSGIKGAISCFKSFNIINTPEVEAFLSKLILAYPVMKPLIRKVKLQNPRTVIFIAREFENKGGHIALATFKKLHEYDSHLNLIYCGPISPNYKEKYSFLLKKISYHEYADYEKSLSLLKKSDVLLLPTLSESLGITFIEVKAVGCIPITYQGNQLEAMREIIINNETGILVKKQEENVDAITESQKFFKEIKDLIYKKNTMEKMKENALNEVTRGQFSFNKRIILLNKLFNSPITQKKEGIDLTNYKVCSFTADEFFNKITNYRKIHKLPRCIYVKGEL